jgi:2-polyprenyl-3-methyl-5-hydroxy-6-metoxy-1,4-benzoquinol methylase
MISSPLRARQGLWPQAGECCTSERFIREAALPASESIALDFPAFLERDFAADFPAAWRATQAVLDRLPGRDFSALARHSPGLMDYQWEHYIRLSAIRMARVGELLRRARLDAGRVLDFGSYFGNFALFLRYKGFEVDAADNYSGYGGALDPMTEQLRSAGAQVLDLARQGITLDDWSANGYDAVLCLGVIEHIPHTPRLLLEALDRVLKPGGSLILDTPNLLYVYTREKIASGRSIFPPIEAQFHVEPPFEGHHREYTSDEVRWMLEAIGHEVTDLELFNYSAYWLSELSGKDAEYWRRMESDPQQREVVMTRSVKRG